MPLKLTDAEIVKLTDDIKIDTVIYCASCTHAGNGCDTQDTVCRVVAQAYPIALTRKDLNNLCYEPNT